MVGVTFAVLAIVVLGLLVVAFGLALERLVGRDRARPPPSHRPPSCPTGRREHQRLTLATAREGATGWAGLRSEVFSESSGWVGRSL
jgi:hypothetical protein